MTAALRPPDWTEAALCAQVGGDTHYPEQGGGNAGTLNEARRLCRACAVSTECLAYALANDERWGVWAGTTPNQRAKMKGRRAS